MPKPRRHLPSSNPVQRAAAIQDFKTSVLDVRVKLFSRLEGEDATDLLNDLALLIGTTCVGGQMEVGRQPWVRTLHGALRTIQALALRGYRWEIGYAWAMTHALEIAQSQFTKLSWANLLAGQQEAMWLASRIRNHEVSPNDVAGTN